MEFIGFMTILFGGVFINFIITALREQAVIDAITTYSPWLSANVEVLTYVVAFVLFLAFSYIHWSTKASEVENGENQMLMIGTGVCTVVAIASVGYLVGVGWVIVTTLLK